MQCPDWPGGDTVVNSYLSLHIYQIQKINNLNNLFLLYIVVAEFCMSKNVCNIPYFIMN